MWDTLFKIIWIVIKALGLDAAGDPFIKSATWAMTAASEAKSLNIQLPEHQKGWTILGVFATATATDFTADVSREDGSHLTAGAVPSLLCLPAPSATQGRSLIPPFDAKGSETITFALVNGATATNSITVSLVARRK